MSRFFEIPLTLDQARSAMKQGFTVMVLHPSGVKYPIDMINREGYVYSDKYAAELELAGDNDTEWIFKPLRFFRKELS